ncbi:MAG: hypothetical protein JW882_20990 [Deltaproteobacteria bacterium]|nr:hypothetical protein [Deltaproteobacteria bacterium]
MKTLRKIPFIGIVVALFISSGFAFAGTPDLKASMAFLPDILETPDKGVFVDLIKMIDSVYDGNIERSVYPFPRSIENVISGKADFHMPMLRNKLVSTDALPYTYTTEKMGDVCIIIYSHKDNPITLEKILQAKGKDPYPYTIECMGGFTDYFDCPISESIGVENSLKKVNLKRIDALLFAQEECDFVIKQFKLKNIHRELYDKFDDVFVIPKGEKGNEINNALSECLVKLKSDGKMQEMHLKVHLPFQEWQPHEMGW